jgi:glycosyltransferase involved in cell wall biosynthesis
MDQPQATVVITTKNRKDELRNAIASALLQDIAIEVLVIDDGSTDGTSEMVRSEFPNVRVDRNETSRGLIVQRTRAASLVTTPYIVSIDDDAVFPSPGIIRQTLADFADDPRIGAVAMPYIDVKKGTTVYQRAPDQRGVWLTSQYRGTAHALRRDLFVQLGGYRGYLFRQGEEEYFCANLVNSGHFVRLGNAEPLHHLESPKRSSSHIAYYNSRAGILNIWYHVPLRFAFIRAMGASFNYARAGLSKRLFWASMWGITAGFSGWIAEWKYRSPLTVGAYRMWRKLAKQGPMEISELTKSLAHSDKHVCDLADTHCRDSI